MKKKLVRVTLAALTRVEYSEVIEVPADMTEAELEALVNQRYDEVDGGEYTSDDHFWEKSDSCEVTAAQATDKADFKLKRNKTGGPFIISKKVTAPF